MEIDVALPIVNFYHLRRRDLLFVSHLTRCGVLVFGGWWTRQAYRCFDLLLLHALHFKSNNSSIKTSKTERVSWKRLARWQVGESFAAAVFFIADGLISEFSGFLHSTNGLDRVINCERQFHSFFTQGIRSLSRSGWLSTKKKCAKLHPGYWVIRR